MSKFIQTHFFTPNQTKRKKIKIFSILPSFFIFPLFHSSNQTHPKEKQGELNMDTLSSNKRLTNPHKHGTRGMVNTPKKDVA